jgi:hypothetical protein
MAKKEQDFVVSDRRRFGGEGELRPDAPPREEDQERPPAAAQPAEAAAAPAETAKAGQGDDSEKMPEAPSEEEQLEQHEAYRASGKKLDDLFATKLGAQGSYPEMTFEKVVESFYMSALIQMGAVRQEGEPSGVDIIGARQTIDSLTILHDKTVGNLSDHERTLLQNVLFELRMAWIELTDAIAKRAASAPAPAAPPSPASTQPPQK